MQNSKSQAGTKAQQSGEADVTMSSSHNAKPHVVRSPFCQTSPEEIKLECLKIAASYAGSPEAVKRLYKEFIELLY